MNHSPTVTPNIAILPPPIPLPSTAALEKKIAGWIVNDVLKPVKYLKCSNRFDGKRGRTIQRLGLNVAIPVNRATRKTKL
jgi:hypothetical protein